MSVFISGGLADMVNIDYLRYAAAVSRLGSFSSAARSCGVTQPALSNGIARLERSLKGQLFERSTRGVVPTSYGEQLLPSVDAVLVAVDHLVARAQELRNPGTRPLRVGVSPLIDPALVTRTFAASRELAPERSLVLREANMAELRSALAAGDLDLILTPAVSSEPAFRQRTLYAEPVAVVPAGTAPSGRARPRPIELADVGPQPLILVPDACGLTAFTVALFADAGVDLVTYPGEAGSYKVLEDWAGLGLGVALLPVSRLTYTAGRARPLLRDGVPVALSYEAAWRRGSPIEKSLASLVGLISGGH